MRKILSSIVVAACLIWPGVGFTASSERLLKPDDICTVRGNIASMIVGQKSTGQKYGGIRDSFVQWLTYGMDGATDVQKAEIKHWYNTWTPDVFEPWFQGVYNKYTEYQVARNTEYDQCKADNNAAPK